MYLTVDFEKYKDPNYPVELTEDETNILKFVDQFDEAMKQQTGKTGGEIGEEDEDDIPLFGKQSYEPKIGSFSLNNLSAGTQAFYFLLIFVVFGGIIVYGYKKIDDDSGPKIKSKKDKKKTNWKNINSSLRFYL